MTRIILIICIWVKVRTRMIKVRTCIIDRFIYNKIYHTFESINTGLIYSGVRSKRLFSGALLKLVVPS